MKLAIPLLAALLSLPSLAAAQDAAPGVAPRRAPIQGETQIIVGEIQRPFAFAVTGRAPLGYTALDDRKSFAPEVTRAVRRDPF